MREFKFAEILTALLKERKIKTKALAEAIGIKRQSISDYCLGRTTPKYPALVKLADYFGVSCDFLLTGVEPQDKQEHQEIGLSGEAIRLLKQCEHGQVLAFIDELLSDPEFYSLLSDALKYKARERSIFEHFHLISSKDPEKAAIEIMDYFLNKDKYKANQAVLSYLNTKVMQKTGLAFLPLNYLSNSLLDEPEDGKSESSDN